MKKAIWLSAPDVIKKQVKCGLFCKCEKHKLLAPPLVGGRHPLFLVWEAAAGWWGKAQKQGNTGGSPSSSTGKKNTLVTGNCNTGLFMSSYKFAFKFTFQFISGNLHNTSVLGFPQSTTSFQDCKIPLLDIDLCNIIWSQRICCNFCPK